MVALLQFLEEAGVLDGERSFSREPLDDGDLVIRERRDGRPAEDQRADRLRSDVKRYAKPGARPAYDAGPPEVRFGVWIPCPFDRDVGRMDRTTVQDHVVADATVPQ